MDLQDDASKCEVCKQDAVSSGSSNDAACTGFTAIATACIRETANGSSPQKAKPTDPLIDNDIGESLRETANGSSATAAAVGTFTLIASVLLNLMIHHWDAVSAVVG